MGKLAIKGVKKTYGSVVALDETDLTIEEGEFVTLLGPSGSGKTTLLMTVAGLAMPDSGEIWIEGKLATYLPVYERDIGMVFQSYALFPHLTVFENLAFPLRMRRRPNTEIRREVERLLDMVQLAGFEGRLPRELSGGQQQRIALARCLIYRPSIVLMDEPLGALDRRLRERMQYEIKRLHTVFGTTILYVTHDQEEALAMSDRIALMNNAGIEQIGAPRDLYLRPASVFVAEFFGESNVLPVQAASDRGSNTFLGPQGTSLRAAVSEDIRNEPQIKMMIRPENVRLLASGDSCDNCLEGTVQQASMLGPITRYAIDIGNSAPIIVKELTASSRQDLTIGQKVRVGWTARDSIILTRDARRAR